MTKRSMGDNVSKPAIARAEQCQVRAFCADDVPQVAQLFKDVFRARAKIPIPTIESYFNDLFLKGPNYDPACPSRVYVDGSGDVSGFIGSLALPMSLGTRPLLAAHACSLMVAEPDRNPLAGARLLRAFLRGPALTFSETSGTRSQMLLTRLGGRVLPAYSMQWMRFLKPLGTGIALSGRRLSLLGALHPIGAFVDRPLTRMISRSAWGIPERPAGYTSTEVDVHEMAGIVRDFA